MKEADLAFLRDIGMYPEALEVLRTGDLMTITGPVLAAYLRVAYVAGRHSARDAYIWHDIPELLGEPHAR